MCLDNCHVLGPNAAYGDVVVLRPRIITQRVKSTDPIRWTDLLKRLQQCRLASLVRSDEDGLFFLDVEPARIPNTPVFSYPRLLQSHLASPRHFFGRFPPTGPNRVHCC